MRSGTPVASWSRQASSRASRLVPPSSKKLSRTPTSSRPRHCRQACQSARSSAPSGACTSAAAAAGAASGRARSARRSTLPVAPSGRASSHTT